MAFISQVGSDLADPRFYYEPVTGCMEQNEWGPVPFLGKNLKVPLWVSSMTGGTSMARTINTNLARACREFGMGMGLGSCRILLEDPKYLPDFDMRAVIGEDMPLFANIGIAQLEHMVRDKETERLVGLVELLYADGLIIHVNPLQEFLQEEGDRLQRPPVETIQAFLEISDLKVIVKEVGQGMGPASIQALLRLPLEAFELAALGGTNFSKIELARREAGPREGYQPLSLVGHSAPEMLEWIRQISATEPVAVKQLILSGGVRNFLDGYYLLSKSPMPSVFGMASAFLKHARSEYQELKDFIEKQIQGLLFARAFLKPR